MAKMKKQVQTSRLQFDVLDLLRASKGIERPDGYSVIPQDIMAQVEEEMLRLYEIEHLSAKLLERMFNHLQIDRDSQLILDLHQFISGPDYGSDGE